jgi:hypothetical protein
VIFLASSSTRFTLLQKMMDWLMRSLLNSVFRQCTFWRSSTKA